MTKEEGSRGTAIVNNENLELNFTNSTSGTANYSRYANAEIQLIGNATIPGTNGQVTLELDVSMPIEVGTELTIRKNGRIVGHGTINQIIE